MQCMCCSYTLSSSPYVVLFLIACIKSVSSIQLKYLETKVGLTEVICDSFSGKDAGPLLMEASLLYDVGPSIKTCNPLADKSNIPDHVEGQINCMDWGNLGLAAWGGSALLDEVALGTLLSLCLYKG